MRPDSYNIPTFKTCRTCAYVYRRELPESVDFFCTAFAVDRPTSGSVQEPWSQFETQRDRGEAMMRWMKWAREREVEPYGTCEEWWDGPKEEE